LRRLRKSFQSVVQEARRCGSGCQYKGYWLWGMVGAAESFYIRLAVAKGNERI
jgi:hypothetical protein